MILAIFFASLPVAVAAEQKTLQMSLTKSTAFEDPYTVEFELSVLNSGMHKGLLQSDGGVTYDYVYLKEYNMDNSPADDPYLTVYFSVNKTGTYDFMIELMAHPGEKKRTGLFQIDDGEKYYVSTVHGERNLVTEYYTGMSAQLTQGTHTMTVYLGEDFNDNTVKSVFLDRFSYVLHEDQVPPPEDGEQGGGNPPPEDDEKEDLTPASGCKNISSILGLLPVLGLVFLALKRK